MSRAQFILAGASLINDNRGVEALGASVVDHLTRSPAVGRVSVLDDGWGIRRSDTPTRPGATIEFVGVRSSRRWHRRESWARVRVDQAFGGLGNPVVDRFAGADAVADLSGGDSFTDLYGARRLSTVCAAKEATLRAARPLVLLPQTFGPFTTSVGRLRAERLVRASAMAYARDAWSHEQLLALAGPGAVPSLLRQGVDVAFGLRPREPEPDIVEQLHDLSDELVVGVNISGLLLTEADRRRFGLVGDYLRTMAALVQALVMTGAFVVLISHVDGGPGESDAAANEWVRAALSTADQERVWVLPPRLRAAELKWCIGHTDWFAGSRMHSTIAALSSGVPTFGYAYSDKTRGVFGTCGVSEHVADARTVTGSEAVDLAMTSFAARDETRRLLANTVPTVVARAAEQLDEVVDAVVGWRDAPDSVSVIA